jgi:NADH:ubiquinone oxidoreductase subunit 6 (subunit J)
MQTTTRTLGEMFMTTYVLPFEVASVVLLVALIGAALIARREKSPLGDH